MPTWRCRPRAKATTSSDNVAVVRRLYELFTDGRIEEAVALLDPDIHWAEPEEAPDRRVVDGADNARAALNDWLSTWDAYELELVEVVACPGDRVFQAMRQRAVGAASGVPFEGDLFQVWTLRDGTPVRAELFFEREQAEAAAGLQVPPIQ
ncbi:MAG TPA: nuclear transport factor 2 family protein [Thermoleophilaceae bacterium]|nr:nuclear transport factor 2 family protein [Thermoleophilaceae bacterium]